jgi:hypothetical protein
MAGARCVADGGGAGEIGTGGYFASAQRADV